MFLYIDIVCMLHVCTILETIYACVCFFANAWPLIFSYGRFCPNDESLEWWIVNGHAKEVSKFDCMEIHGMHNYM